MDENRREWLDSLNVGDKVAVNSYWSGYWIGTITKITPTRQIELNNCSQKYRDGVRMIDSYHYEHLYPLTDEIHESVFRRVMCTKLRTMKFEDLSTNQLKRIREIINESNNK